MRERIDRSNGNVTLIDDKTNTSFGKILIDGPDNSLFVVGKLPASSNESEVKTTVSAIKNKLTGYGAKQFILLQLPPGTYIAANDYPKCPRIRHASKDRLQKHSINPSFESKYEVLTSWEAIIGKNPKENLTKLAQLMAQANFTAGKQLEYKEAYNLVARLMQGTPFLVKERESNNFVAFLRAYSVSEDIVYLSDETICNKTISDPLQFQFMQSFLGLLTTKYLPNVTDYFLIAAKKDPNSDSNEVRPIYEKLGFSSCPEKFCLTLSFDRPQPAMVEVKQIQYQEAKRKLDLVLAGQEANSSVMRFSSSKESEDFSPSFVTEVRTAPQSYRKLKA